MLTEKASNNDMYAALMLSDLLNNEQHNVPPPLPPHEEPCLPVDDVIWQVVPADKHPQIAPNEFANFLRTHGANIPTRRSSSLRRRESILSQSISPRENEEDPQDSKPKRSLSEKKKAFLKRMQDNQLEDPLKDSQIFDKHSSAKDDSNVIVKTDKSLLRRSAFSARGRSRKSKEAQRRSLSHRRASSNGDARLNTWDKSVGISLYDQPVNLSEWIDLGSASLESNDSQRGMLSRVHDAESELLCPPKPIPKRTSWLAGLFKKESNSISGLTSLLQRSFSLKSPKETPKRASSRLEAPIEPFFNPYRFPLHVERAIYRLSHMKLADPRRPLRQQVLISNLMFWYIHSGNQGHPERNRQPVEKTQMAKK
ncbi:hypothetical protein A0J61_01842 [Choanephora cucurbitarum]|uniref:Protein Zds1 C-terminal domain-containing protein n=1 Tax=Choanephora cucurbitarum TaxID=101091 RepID=A0A1C7NLU6_9FUNG|nr:hypothetical protein A0J61_01842 [Choanephora cucurbitarum]